MKLWADVRRLMIEESMITAQEWETAIRAARVRYRKEIRQYRGIDVLRRRYHQRRGRKW